MDLQAFFSDLAPELSRFINEDFPHRCSITRPTTSATDYGSETAGTPITVASSVGCSYAPGGTKAEKYLRANKIVATAPYAVTLPVQIDGTELEMEAKDQIVITDGPTLEVLGPPLNNGGLSLFVVCRFVG